MSSSPDNDQRTLILHGGMHKTGSSAIQEYLYQHLDEPGVEYFCFDRPNSSLVLLEAFHSSLESLPHYEGKELGAEDFAAKRAKARQRFQRRLAASDSQTLIISAESFSLLSRAECEDLAEQLREYYPRIKLVLYIRPLRSRIESAFQQKLKQRWIPLEDRVVTNFKKQISNYDKVFGRENVNIRPYSPDEFPGNSVVNDFLQLCGLPPGDKSTSRVNVGLSLPAVQLLYIYRLKYPQAAAEDDALLARLSALPGERFRLHRKLLHKILVERDDGYGWLEERAGVSLYDGFDGDGVQVASERDLLQVSDDTLQWLEQQTAGLVTAAQRPGQEALAIALKTWAKDISKEKGGSYTGTGGGSGVRKLVLHIGMAKTGTSSIQESLGRGAALLAEQGVYYPDWKPYNHSFNFTVLFLEDPRKSFHYQQLAPISEEDWQAELQGLKEQWRDFFSSREQGVWIVSAENLGRLSEPGLAALRTFIEPFFDELRVVAYVRDPLRALKSQWEQNVKELREPMSAQALLSLTKQRQNYRFFQRWIEAFGRDNFVLRRFDPSGFAGGELLTDFLQAAQVELERELELPELEANQSLGAEGVALLLAMNSRYPLYRDGQINTERGLSRRLHLFYAAMRRAGADPLSLEIKFSAEEAERFNRKIDFLNSLLPAGEGFDHVVASEDETLLPDLGHIPAGYAVELINNLSHLVDQMADSSEHLQEKIKELEAKLEKRAGDQG